MSFSSLSKNTSIAAFERHIASRKYLGRDDYIGTDPQSLELRNIFKEHLDNHGIGRKRNIQKSTVSIQYFGDSEYSVDRKLSSMLERETPREYFVGGPPALMAAAVRARQGGDESGSSHKVTMVNDDWGYSAAVGSASYLHVRHSNGLPADPRNRPMAIVKETFLRKVLGYHGDILDPNYQKIDIDLSIGEEDGLSGAAKDAWLFAKAFVYTYHQVARGKLGLLTDWDIARELSKSSVAIMEDLDRARLESRRSSKEDDGERMLYGTGGNAWHVAFTECEIREVEEENVNLHHVNGIESLPVSRESVDDLLGPQAKI